MYSEHRPGKQIKVLRHLAIKHCSDLMFYFILNCQAFEFDPEALLLQCIANIER